MANDEVTEMRGIAAKQDLADRYQKMLDSQLTAISNFDTKAWRVARLVGILLGVFITGVSIFSSEVAIQLSIAVLPVIGSVAAGLVALMISLIFAILSILSTTASFGLTVELSDALNEGELDKEDYPGIITKSYSKNIENNIKVMRAKGRRLRYSLSSLIFGIVALSTGAFLLFVSLGIWEQIGILVVLGISTAGVVYYILTMQYSVLENGDEGEGQDGSDT